MTLRATSVKPAGTWSGPAVDTVVLDYDNRHRRRIAMRGQGGLTFLLDLDMTRLLRDGDGLVIEDGRVVAVAAAPERLLHIACDDPLHLLRVAWHLGNRHLETELRADGLRIRDDPVIAEMLVGLGARITVVEAPFDPEGGAYAHHRTDDAADAHG